jgi:hypothetical protein
MREYNFKQQFLIAVSSAVAFAVVLVACGGGSHGSGKVFGSSPAKTILASTPILGGNLFAKSDSARVNLAGFFLQAALPAPTTFAQSFHGVCSTGPGNSTNAVMYHQINGFGSSECATSGGNISPSDRLLTETDISDPNRGALVIDPGVLSNMIVLGGAGDSTSGEVVVFVNGKQVTGIGCLVGRALRCSSRNLAIPVADGDHVAVYERMQPGTTFPSVHEVFITKS